MATPTSARIPERPMFRLIATLLLAGAAVGPAMAQGKVVVYTSNDSNLNRFVYDAFKKETGSAWCLRADPAEIMLAAPMSTLNSDRSMKSSP